MYTASKLILLHENVFNRVPMSQPVDPSLWLTAMERRWHRGWAPHTWHCTQTSTFPDITAALPKKLEKKICFSFRSARNWKHFSPRQEQGSTHGFAQECLKRGISGETMSWHTETLEKELKVAALEISPQRRQPVPWTPTVAQSSTTEPGAPCSRFTKTICNLQALPC